VHKNAGSTATIAILVDDYLLVANVGDSRAVMCRAGKGEGKSLLVLCLCIFIIIMVIIYSEHCSYSPVN
jgi:hypothetical protein